MSKSQMLDARTDFDLLARRIGQAHLGQRLNMQAHHASQAFGRGINLLHIENLFWLHYLLEYTLKACGVYSRGYRNFKDIQLVENIVSLRHLPQSFEGFRILHLSDLHIDLDLSLIEEIGGKLKGLEYDLCVLTGDYRSDTKGDYTHAVNGTAAVIGFLKPPIYAVLGNHDFIEMVSPLEHCGVRFLLNETVGIERNGEQIFLCGIDDPHFYQSDSFIKAREGIPPGATSILLSHSPEVYRRANGNGFDLMLCGHTHGGQICLPGGAAILRNGRCPRRLISGPWEYEEMKGYTSRGTGSCGVAARYFCPPEITLHRLERE